MKASEARVIVHQRAENKEQKAQEVLQKAAEKRKKKQQIKIRQLLVDIRRVGQAKKHLREEGEWWWDVKRPLLPDDMYFLPLSGDRLRPTWGFNPPPIGHG